MILADIRAGETVYIDANVLVYHFSADPQYGAACTNFFDRVPWLVRYQPV
jgi:predicted nucleic acid-binding protein